MFQSLKGLILTPMLVQIPRLHGLFQSLKGLILTALHFRKDRRLIEFQSLKGLILTTLTPGWSTLTRKQVSIPQRSDFNVSQKRHTPY